MHLWGGSFGFRADARLHSHPVSAVRLAGMLRLQLLRLTGHPLCSRRLNNSCPRQPREFRVPQNAHRTCSKHTMNDKKLHIVFLFQDLEFGGLQRHTVDLARQLTDRFEPIYIAHAGRVIEELVPVQMVGRVRALHKGKLRDPRSWIAIGRAVAAEKPDVIVALNQVAMALAMTAKILGIVECPVVTVFHSTEVKSRSAKVWTYIYRLATRTSDGIIYISSNQRDIWVARGLTAKRVELIRNGLETERFPIVTEVERAEARAQLGFADGDFVVGCVAVMRPEKNIHQLVDALATLRRAGVGARLLLVGDGPCRRDIEQHVASLGLADVVVFAGFQKDVRPFVAAFDVGVLASIAIETLSIAALEIMAMGIPMVLSDIGGASEIVSPEVDGYLFPPGDTPALVAALTQCTDKTRLAKLGAAAARKVRTEFQHSHMCARYADLFVELTGAYRAQSMPATTGQP